MKVTGKMIEAFKVAWHAADDAGRRGHRSEAGIQAVLDLLPDPSGAGRKIRELSEWIDDHPANHARNEEANLWGRTMKVAEEVGEVTAAMIGATFQNPRKGMTHTMADVRKELLDVALSALTAVEHIDGNAGDAFMALEEHAAWVHRRAGLS